MVENRIDALESFRKAVRGERISICFARCEEWFAVEVAAFRCLRLARAYLRFT